MTVNVTDARLVIELESSKHGNSTANESSAVSDSVNAHVLFPFSYCNCRLMSMFYWVTHVQDQLLELMLSLVFCNLQGRI